MPCHSVARVKANLTTFSAFRFKNKTHFSDMKCGPLSVNGILSCLQAANICHKINFKLPTPCFFFRDGTNLACLENWFFMTVFCSCKKNSLMSVMCVYACMYAVVHGFYDEPFFHISTSLKPRCVSRFNWQHLFCLDGSQNNVAYYNRPHLMLWIWFI